MVRKMMLGAAIGLSALAIAGCAKDTTDWGAVAAGTGMIINGTHVAKDIDPRIAQVSDKLAQYCPLLQVAAAVGTAAIPENKRTAGLQAQAALNEVCAAPPRDVPAAVAVAAKAYLAARAAGITPPS